MILDIFTFSVTVRGRAYPSRTLISADKDLDSIPVVS